MRRQLVGALFVLLSCTGPRRALNPEHAPKVVSLCAAGVLCPDTVFVEYLGVHGFVLRHGATAVMTAPLFTHRGLLPTYLGFTFRSDTTLVDRILRQLGSPVHDVSTMLVGHSHYDHALDVPYIARKYLDGDARVVGTPALGHILAAEPRISPKVLAIPADDVGTASQLGKWVYAHDGRSRVMALASSHAPNFLSITFASGGVDTNLKTLPRSARGWKLGEVYAYVVDFIRTDSTPEFRFVFQDAVSRPEYNRLPPFSDKDVHAVNLAVICAGNFNKAKDYPQTLLTEMHPEHVIVGHWDDFFDEWQTSPDVVILTKTKDLAHRLDSLASGKWQTLFPGARARIAFRP